MLEDDYEQGRGSSEKPRRGNDGWNRRSVLKGAVAGAAVVSTGLAGCTGSLTGGGGGPIRVGSLSDRSGPLAVYGNPMTQATELAVAQINDDDGLLDREVELINPDPQSSNDQYQNLARRLILEDEVDILLGGISSASREAIRPIIDENKQLYFYPALYEGGVCDEYTYLTGPEPTQQIEPLVEFMLDEFGPNVYTLAADYNFGQISALWTERLVDQNNGSLVGEEFIPLSVSDFGSTINRIESENPDWLMSFLVGANHIQFFEQFHSEGLEKPMGSTVQAGASYDHLTLNPPLLTDLYISFNYVEELPGERNEEFVNNFRDMFPDAPYINQHAQSQYMSLMFWRTAVENTDTVEMSEVSAELESGIGIEAPEGDVQIDPATHHTNHDIHILRVDENHELNALQTIEDINPTWLQERCQLASESTWDDPITEQFIPE